MLSAYLMLIVGILANGFSAIFVRQADAPGTVASFYRVAIPTLVLVAPAVRGLRNQKCSRSQIQWAIAGGLLFAIDISFWASGVVISGAAIPTLLANAAPMWVGLGTFLFFHEKLPKKFWLGLTIALIGTSIVLGLNFLQPLSFDLGAILGMLGGIFYAGYFLVTQIGRKSLDTLSYFWLSGVSGTILLFIYNMITNQPMLGFSSNTYCNLLAHGLISQGIGFLAINYAQGLLPAAVVSTTLLVSPVITALLAVLILGERFQLTQMIGGATVLVGVYIVRLGWAITNKSHA